MKKMIKFMLLSISMFGVQQVAFAGAPMGGIISVASKQTQNRVYAGLVWTLNQKTEVTPNFVTVGARSVVVKSNDNVSGADLNIRLNVKDGFNVDSTRLSFVGGNRDIQGNIGIGYSFSQQSFLGTLGGSSAYSKVGGDYFYKSKEFAPFLELNTMDKPKKVNENTVFLN